MKIGPAGLWHDPAMGMRYAPGQKDQVARASPELLIAALVDVLPLDDVVHLVLAGMHVPRGIQQRSRLFEHGKGAARHRRRRTDDDRRPTEDQLLALARPPGERTQLSDHRTDSTHHAGGRQAPAT